MLCCFSSVTISIKIEERIYRCLEIYQTLEIELVKNKEAC